MSAQNQRPSSSTLPSDRVPTVQKLCYGAGCLAGQFALPTVIQMFNPVFNIALGISPAVLGIVLAVYRLWDALTDVIMGNLSDNTRTRWGRRRPFIVAGAILSGCTLPLLWQASPAWSQPVTVAYIVIVGLVLYTFTTIWGMPYYSLGMELTPDYHERTRVMAVRAVFEKIAAIVAGWLLALASLDVFANPITGEPDVANGMRHISWGLGGLLILFGVLPGVFVKERFYKTDASRQPKVPFWASLKLTLTCRPFLIVMGVYLLQVVGSKLVYALGLYLNIYYVNGGNLEKAAIIQGWAHTAMYVLGIVTVPLWTWIAEKLGKRMALGLTIALGFLGNALIYFCYTPEHPYLQIVPLVFLFSFGSAIWMLIPSMQADIADYDELSTGERREGSFASVSSWCFKLAVTVAMAAAGGVLSWTGFDVVKFGAQQPAEVLDRMLAVYIFLPMAFWIVALVLLARYPLNREKLAQIRLELEARRGAL